MIVWLALVLGSLHQLQHTSALPRLMKWGEDRVLYQHNKPWDGNSYSYGFQTLFGSSRKEKAILKKDALGEDYIDVEGEYTYPSPDGSIRRVSYRSNLLGYQASEDSVRIDWNNYNTVTHNGSIIHNVDHKFAHEAQDHAVVADTFINPNLEVAAGTLNQEVEMPEIALRNNSSVYNVEVTKNNILKSPQQIKNNDIIHFPTDENEVTLTISTEQNVLTTAATPPIATGATNETVDYYYDELGNRIGGVPPAVLGSLLG